MTPMHFDDLAHSTMFIVSDILNHPQQQQQQQQTSQRRMSCFSPVNGRRLSSPPLSPLGYERRLMQVHGKPRSRFSDVEDTIICEGVAKGLTWGQISRQLPHRKRATCFNRYRTLQGIRKSRKRSTASILEQNEQQQQQQQRPVTPPTSPDSSHSASSSAASLSPSWYPCTPPAPVMSSSTPDHHQQHQLLPSPHQLLFTSHDMAAPCYPERRLSSTTSVDSDDARLPPLIVPSARYATTITTATKTTAT